ncbi:MAG: bifunctional diaminohydroxyphosphoribosylaminopyrimidine deaminase/5-amino-6-(5-phosphoribosylamino)uracil reductase RibD [Rhodospirillaceae bacterium]|nr:bifunctional diaminohydroxyphosphoribosylaminopyrimidine deaminase/5-amino-6-(5-phosphoribosylamino)uracil reductase RibD [Rhodospirillaceae bacterium]
MNTTKDIEQDRRFMRGAIALARRGLGNVWPNPAVGCVIVNDGRVVGRGWTQPGGRPHAETEAIKRAGAATQGATAYVTLEPCAHSGKTPPCADALVNAGIKRVVIATTDPDPRTAGRGVQKLMDAGIDVSQGVIEADAKYLNAGFFNLINKQKPIFSLKIAASKDGYIASGPGIETNITGAVARNRGHMLRAAHDMVLFGIGTLLADDPEYTCRLPGMENQTPVRTLLDSKLQIPLDARILKTLDKGELWIFCGRDPDVVKKSALEDMGVKVIAADKVDDDARPELGWLVEYIGKKGITRVLVEAGARLNAAFIKAGLIERIHWFEAPIELGAGSLGAFGNGGQLKEPSTDKIFGFQMVDKRSLGGDTYMVYDKTAPDQRPN